MEHTRERLKPFCITDLSIMDWLILKAAKDAKEAKEAHDAYLRENPEAERDEEITGSIYGYGTREEYKFVGKAYNTGVVYRQLSRLSEDGFLAASEEKIPSRSGPAIRLHTITTRGLEVLEEGRPIFMRILGIEVIRGENQAF